MSADVWATKICHFDSLHQHTTQGARGAVQDEEQLNAAAVCRDGKGKQTRGERP